MKYQGLGFEGEALATTYLKSHGFLIVEKNYVSRFGEIDAIATKEEYICFIEIKTRKALGNKTSGFESISLSKQKKIMKTAEYYLAGNKKFKNLQPRFDCMEINMLNEGAEINFIENAFSI